MSEYQYYEFLAIDRPLNKNEMDELRAVSTRAVITPVSFTNEYHWGSFKGDPVKLMQNYFDAHVHVANWMSARFMVRLPIDALSVETAKAFAVPYTLDFKADKTHWVITWSLDESENYDRFGEEDGRGWMERLTPIRDELLRGDLRSLYIGWLGAVYEDMADDDEMEPLCVCGLGNLSPAQKALAEFLEINPDLLTGAGMGSPAFHDDETPQKDRDEWIHALPRDDVFEMLKQLLDGKGHQAERTLRNRFSEWLKSRKPDQPDVPRRTLAELWENAEKAKQIRKEKEYQSRKRREAEQKKKREAYLQNLSKDLKKAWKAAETTIERGNSSAYDEASALLKDISDACTLMNDTKGFQESMKTLMSGHMRRKALVQRLVKAGIWKEK